MLNELPKLEPPKEPRGSNLAEKQAVGQLRRWFSNEYRKNGVIFMTASGVETDENDFPGPHVGSYYNMLFKRAILQSGCPIVMFLDERKLLEKHFIKGYCFPVCDPVEMPWLDICQNKPFAIALAFSSKENSDRGELLLKKLKLETSEIRQIEGEKIWALVATNAVFRKLWARNDASNVANAQEHEQA